MNLIIAHKNKRITTISGGSILPPEPSVEDLKDDEILSDENDILMLLNYLFDGSEMAKLFDLREIAQLKRIIES